MRLARILLHRLQSLTRRQTVEAELDSELQLHLDQLTKEYQSEGMSLPAAPLAARRAFGPAGLTKEQCRDMRRVNLIDDLIKDIFYTFRLLKKSPGFALTAIVSLALGIGANTIVFSILNALVLKPIPAVDPESIVFVNRNGHPANSFPDYRDLRNRNSTFQSLFSYRIAQIGLEDSAGAHRIGGSPVTGIYFEALRINPALGRFSTPAEDVHVNASPYAVLSYTCWRNRFGAAPEIAGKDIRLNGRPYRVLGVAPEGFD